MGPSRVEGPVLELPGTSQRVSKVWKDEWNSDCCLEVAGSRIPNSLILFFFFVFVTLSRTEGPRQLHSPKQPRVELLS